ncbi:HNH endonuclease [Halomonas sp. MCCC 1A11062]|uniref:HNH endonuclease n=1 Tax=Halomonas sp. MCCC 1A11062 TaxID=2733485 RepID=UPI001F3E0087|nr:HNH endonuclease [Halomonas sp. MCCC 1A11062]MCE8036373.1 HNH endonuclease [Halomonas sp. MCCC 1A11062]
MKAVFDTKPTSIYDDLQTEHYQFPRRYLNIVQRCENDWVVLRRPRADGGNLSYFAVAKVARIEQDPINPSMFYARYADYLQFDDPVPWRVEGRYAEEELRNIPQTQVGVYLRGRSVRRLSDEDFAALVASGLHRALSNTQSSGLLEGPLENITKALTSGLPEERDRKVKLVLTSRVVREANFRDLVCNAYEGRCAITGLYLADHAGNLEVQGAHIWAVADGGPDMIQNGIALTATVHWLFDRHLISLSDNYELLIADGKIPLAFRKFFGDPSKRIALPKREADRPHPGYIAKHRALFLAKNRE